MDEKEEKWDRYRVVVSVYRGDDKSQELIAQNGDTIMSSATFTEVFNMLTGVVGMSWGKIAELSPMVDSVVEPGSGGTTPL